MSNNEIFHTGDHIYVVLYHGTSSTTASIINDEVKKSIADSVPFSETCGIHVILEEVDVNHDETTNMHTVVARGKII